MLDTYFDIKPDSGVDKHNSYIQFQNINICTSYSALKHPVLFNRDSHISALQRCSNSVIILHYDDWNKVVNRLHTGAFGKDFDIWDEFKAKGRYRKAMGFTSPIVVIWKFPGGLQKFLPNPILNIPLSVGTYYLDDDRWWVPPYNKNVSYQSEEMQKNSKVEKKRVDHKNGGSIHYLESTDRKSNVIMLSSKLFVNDYYNITDAELVRMKSMLFELYDDLEIYAFSCFTQHHAIVLYIDLLNGCRIDLSHIKDIIHDTHRFKSLLNVLCKYSINPNLVLDLFLHHIRLIH